MTFTNEEWADICDRKARFFEIHGHARYAEYFRARAAKFRAKAAAAEKCSTCEGWGGGNGGGAEAHCPECGY